MSSLPNGWNSYTLDDVSERVTVGLAISTTKYYRPFGIPMLRNLNIKAGYLDESEVLCLDPDFALAHKSRMLKAGDIVTVRTGYAGISCVVPEKFVGAHTFTTLITTPKHSIVDSYYLAFLINSAIGDKEIERLIAGGGRNNLNAQVFSEFRMMLPPLPEQRAIAAILRTWDEAISHTAALIDALKRRKSALMSLLLTGKTRFSEFEIKQWKHLRIAEFLQPIKRSNRFTQNLNNRLVSVRRRSGGLFWRQDSEDDESPASNLYEIQAGDFLISRRQVVHGAMALVPPEFDRSFVSDSYITLVPQAEADFDIRFFDWLSKTKQLYRMAYTASHGVHIEKLFFDLDAFLQNYLSLPADRSEQVKIADTLQTCEEEIEIYAALQEELRKQKRGLMQQLLTGAVRVKVEEETEVE